MLRVAVVIPNRNRAALLERTLASVRSQTLAPERVVVVDNGSTDGSATVARQAGAELLEWPGNRGFAAAVNAGARMCEEEWLLILNNDAELQPGCLAALAEAAVRNQAVCVAPRVLRLADPSRMDGAWDLLARGGIALRCGHGLADGAEWRTEGPILFAPLTAALVRRDVFWLDDAYGSYLEDVDLSLRLTLDSHRLIYAPAAVVLHHGSATLGAWSPEMVYRIARNQVLLLARHYPRRWWIREGWAVAVGQGLWGLAALRHRCLGAWLRGKWRGMTEYRAHRRPAPDAARFRALLRASERQLRNYVRAHPSWFWRVYCALTGAG